MEHWNWTGLLFALFILPATGALAMLLRRWGQRGEASAPPTIEEYDASFPEHDHRFDPIYSKVEPAPGQRLALHCDVYGCSARMVLPAARVEGCNR